MFLPYKIDIEVVKGLQEYSYEEEYSILSEAVLKERSRDELRKVLIDGSKLQEEWFPTEGLQFDVFLSHSHGDEDEAKRLAAYLKAKYGLKTFIDSCYWNYCDSLLKQLDEQLWEETDGTGLFNYKKRNYSTTIIHTMLSMSLLKMMGKCECFLLMDSKNVRACDDYKSKTLSAWIYQEAEMSKAIERKVPQRWLKNIVGYREGGILETRYFSSEGVATESQSVTFNLDTSKMHQITNALLIRMLGSGGSAALDIMHKEYISKQYSDLRLLEKSSRILSIKRIRR